MQGECLSSFIGQYHYTLLKLFKTLVEVIIECNILSMIWNLVSIYGKNTSFFRNTFLDLSTINRFSIVGGDFNCALNPTIDCSTGHDTGKTQTRELLKQFKEVLNLVDVWREQNPDEKNHYSCYSSTQKSHSRIDYFIISRELLPNVSECWYNGIVISDHAAVSLKIQIDKIVHSQPNQRFKARWLQEQAFVDTPGSKFTSFFALNTDETNTCIRQEAFKAFIRGQIITYTSYKTKHCRASGLDDWRSKTYRGVALPGLVKISRLATCKPHIYLRRARQVGEESPKTREERKNSKRTRKKQLDTESQQHRNSSN